MHRELALLWNLYTMAITWRKAVENSVQKVRFARENNGRMCSSHQRRKRRCLPIAAHSCGRWSAILILEINWYRPAVGAQAPGS